MDRFEPLVAGKRIGGHDVLIGVYEHATKTAGGIYIPETKLDENKYQGKVGLVMKLGPLCWTGNAKGWFGDEPPKVGDWVVFDVNASWPFLIGKYTFRMVQDQFVRAVIDHPDEVY